MAMIQTVDQFVKALAEVEENEIMVNPFRHQLQQQNLTKYLNYFIDNPPNCLLVGEAAGYNGCRHSGIPFTDEYRFTERGRLGCKPLEGFSKCNILLNHRDKPHMEKSDTVIWEALVANDFFPLLWNIFPFHPHKKGNKDSNRTPTPAEIAMHWHFTKDLLGLFPEGSITIYAVGKKSFDCLTKNGFSVQYIRHPARGGKDECQAGIKSASELTPKI